MEVLALTGAGNPRDAVEPFLRDHIERGRRTEARTAVRDEALREVGGTPRGFEGGAGRRGPAAGQRAGRPFSSSAVVEPSASASRAARTRGPSAPSR